jgi:restriction system protein
MAIPDYQSLMLPLLRLASDRKEHQLRAAIETLADEFALTHEERNELLPSGGQAIFANRVGWARTYLKQAGSTLLAVVSSESRRMALSFSRKSPSA